MAKILLAFIALICLASAEHDHTKHLSPEKIRETVQTIAQKDVQGFVDYV